MKTRRDEGTSGRLAVTFLTALASLLGIAIVLVTVWAFASGRARPGFWLNAVDMAVSSVQEPQQDTAFFADFGQLRPVTADDPPVTVIIRPILAYPVDDLPFREELVSKTATARQLMTNWFAERSVDELDRLGDDAVKKALLTELNDLYTMGHVSALYFEDFVIIR